MSDSSSEQQQGSPGTTCATAQALPSCLKTAEKAPLQLHPRTTHLPRRIGARQHGLQIAVRRLHARIHKIAHLAGGRAPGRGWAGGQGGSTGAQSWSASAPAARPAARCAPRPGPRPLERRPSPAGAAGCAWWRPQRPAPAAARGRGLPRPLHSFLEGGGGSGVGVLTSGVGCREGAQGGPCARAAPCPPLSLAAAGRAERHKTHASPHAHTHSEAGTPECLSTMRPITASSGDGTYLHGRA